MCDLPKRIRVYLLKPQFSNDIRNGAGESGPACKFHISAKRASPQSRDIARLATA